MVTHVNFKDKAIALPDNLKDLVARITGHAREHKSESSWLIHNNHDQGRLLVHYRFNLPEGMVPMPRTMVIKSIAAYAAQRNKINVMADLLYLLSELDSILSDGRIFIHGDLHTVAYSGVIDGKSAVVGFNVKLEEGERDE